MFNRKSLLLATTLFSALPFMPAQAQVYTPGTSTNWFNQINLTQVNQSAAAGGAGMVLGIVDTGIAVSNVEFGSRVSVLSGCAATTFKCSNGVNDDNGHGTAVAAIAAGNMMNTAARMTGVAPYATIVSEKVLNASGTGTSTDVASGIIKAANANASVINLSLTYTPTTEVISAINYAASKGATIVYAAGNNASTFNRSLSTSGLSAAALQRLVIVGSVDGTNKMSSFSNTAGNGSAGTGTSYASIYVVAPGQTIFAPNVGNSPTSWANWSGTSMAAPIVSGSLILLENTWPILKTNGTAAKLLFNTTTDLGAVGVDSIYGNGLINLNKAFAPNGALTVSAGSKTYAVTSLNTSLLVGGALGNFSAVSGLLANYTAFDGYARNYRINLSGLASTKTSNMSAAIASASVPQASTATKFADGSMLMMSRTEGERDVTALGLNNGGEYKNEMFIATLSQTDGTVMSVGRGYSPAFGFASALWGADNVTANQSASLGVSNAFMELTQGGGFASYGSNLGNVRLATSFSSTEIAGQQSELSNTWMSTKSSALGFGASTLITDGWTSGLTVSMLDETSGLLGSNYDSKGPLSLGDSHQSVMFGMSHAFKVATHTNFLVDAAVGQTNGARMADSFVTSVSPMVVRTYGASIVQSALVGDSDSLTLSVKKPLRVVSGSANVATMDVDANGSPTTSQTKVSLVPSGNQTDFGVAYAAPLADGVSMNAQMSYSQDAMNIAGERDVGGKLGFNVKF